MSEKLSCLITDFLLRKNVIEEEEKDIYFYGYETLIYSIEQIILFLVLGMLLGKFASTLIFLIVFVSMRRFTGGYHASSRTGCTLMTVLCYFLVLMLGEGMCDMQKNFLMLLLCTLFSVIIFLCYVPVVHPNKPLTKKQKKESKKKSIFLFAFYFVISLLTYHVLQIILFLVMSTMVVIAVLIILQMLKVGKMKQRVLKAVAIIGEKAAKRAVCSSSPWSCYQFQEPEIATKRFLASQKSASNVSKSNDGQKKG